MSQFIWYELMTEDADSATTFYREVVGWETEPFGGGDQGYTLFKAGEQAMGGAIEIQPEARAAGARPAWLGYIAVDAVDEATARIRSAGGKVHMDMKDIPGVGDIAMASDPQGAHFYIIAPRGQGDGGLLPFGARGGVGWHELHSSDWESGFDFYSGLFGWAKDEAMDMGPMGTYQLFGYGSGNAIGGMFNSNTLGPPAWLFYFVVGDIDEAAGRVAGAGGQVLSGPMEVPGGAWVIRCSDPQGAMFALVGTRNSKGE